jgi:hypothetical protein
MMSSPDRPRNSQSSPARTISIVAWVILLLGAAVLSLGLYGAQKGYETTRWQQVAAEIVDRDVALSDDVRKKRTASGRKVRRVSRDALAMFHVTFRYEVDGEEFLSGGVERGSLGMQNTGRAKELGRLYPVGMMTTVAVNPAGPQEAYLVTGISTPAKMLTIIGALLLAAGLLVRKLARSVAASGS